MKKIVKIGNVSIGGKNPPAVQGMVKTLPSDKKTIPVIKEMEEAGCRMVRIAVPSADEIKHIPGIKENIRIPLIADIHFDWSLAVKAAAAGVDKIRINPSNIGSSRKVGEIARICRERKIPVRVGSNSGSVKSLNRGDSVKTRARKLFNAVAGEVGILEKAGFKDIVVSAKAEDVPTTIEVNYLLDKLCYPIHIGVTATGTEDAGIIKSSIALGSLLSAGIGNTIRVSLLSDPVSEVKAAYSILSEIGLSKRKINFITCPTCGRCGVDLKSILENIASCFPDRNFEAQRTLNVAVMGCEVNGPGEARNADFGIAFAGDKAIYFENGKIIKTLEKKSAAGFLIQKIKQFLTPVTPLG